MQDLYEGEMMMDWNLDDSLSSKSLQRSPNIDHLDYDYNIEGINSNYSSINHHPNIAQDLNSFDSGFITWREYYHP